MRFQVEEKDRHVLVKCPERMDAIAGAELLDLAKQWVKKPSLLYVLDFRSVKEMDSQIFNPAMLFHQALRKQGCYLMSINLAPALAEQIRNAGLEFVFTPREDIHQAMSSAGIGVPRAEILTRFVKPFVHATEVTFGTQVGLQLKAGKAYSKDPNATSTTSIAALINLGSRAFQGSIALCFPSAVFLAIYSRFVGEDALQITPEIEDAAAEFLNMIFGVAKAELNDQEGYRIEQAIPAVITGEKLRVLHFSRGKAVVVPFETPDGVFSLEISLDSR